MLSGKEGGWVSNISKLLILVGPSSLLALLSTSLNKIKKAKNSSLPNLGPLGLQSGGKLSYWQLQAKISQPNTKCNMNISVKR